MTLRSKVKGTGALGQLVTNLLVLLIQYYPLAYKFWQVYHQRPPSGEWCRDLNTRINLLILFVIYRSFRLQKDLSFHRLANQNEKVQLLIQNLDNHIYLFFALHNPNAFIGTAL